ncbi:hypothetical protein VQ01_00420 [Tamlana sp. s12]|nr:hypothetical protein VQ01_00420 [Tamlana sp. s12]
MAFQTNELVLLKVLVTVPTFVSAATFVIFVIVVIFYFLLVQNYDAYIRKKTTGLVCMYVKLTLSFPTVLLIDEYDIFNDNSLYNRLVTAF